jgi:hypothetical protein
MRHRSSFTDHTPKGGLVRSLHLFVVRTLVERYRVVVEDDFDETDDMALQELFAEGLDKPTPYETFESDVEVSVDPTDNDPDL